MGLFSKRERPQRPLPGPAVVFLARSAEARRRERLDDLTRRLRRVRADVVRCREQEFLPGKRTRVHAGRLANYERQHREAVAAGAAEAAP